MPAVTAKDATATNEGESLQTQKKVQLKDHYKKVMEKQGYRIVGEHRHSAVKVCGWTRSMIKGKGGCYKLTFYGIQSHQCMQMTTSMSCANRCTFCWRDYKSPVSEKWEWEHDNPVRIMEESLRAHDQLLIGFKGDPGANADMYQESRTVRHVALSLTGEPIIYPRINELVLEFHKRRISTFLVTNAQYPDAIKTLLPITQLYISVDAPNKKLLKEVDVPLFKDYWERLLQSLDNLAIRNDRTVIRLTCIKGINMCDLEGYKELIERGDPDCIEIKGYMHVGASQQRLAKENMPSHDEVKAWGIELADMLADYEYVSQHKPSRVILLAKKSFKKKTWIDFEKFFDTYATLLDEAKAYTPDIEQFENMWSTMINELKPDAHKTSKTMPASSQKS